MDLNYETQRRAIAARYAILEAGRLTWDYFERGVPFELKADETPVTVADREAELLLRKHVQEHFPGDGFLGEEYGEEPSSTGYRWIIDPIDGTKNFVRGVPLYANLIGLEYEGKVVAGLCNIPSMNRLYHAVKGQGAYCNDRRIRVSDVSDVKKAHFLYTSIDWFDKVQKTNAFLTMARGMERTRGFGDFFGFVMVAQGAGEVVVDPQVAPWDIAALKPIAEEAGGVFTDLSGNDTIYGNGAVVGNPAIHAAVLEILRKD